MIVSDIFNRFFCKVASNIQASIKPLSVSETRLMDHTMSQHNNTPNSNIPVDKFHFRDVNVDELKLLLKKIEKHKNS